jgi:hypothetical protein
MRHAGDIGIAQQRQDGVVVRRGGDFDLAGAGQLRYSGSTWPTISRCFSPMRCWSSSVKLRPRARPTRGPRVVLLKLLVEPGELRPHLQVAKILRAESGGAPRRSSALPGVEELAVARIAIDHALRIGIEGMAQQESAVGVGEAFGGLESQPAETDRGFAGSVLGHLRHHGRHQVEGLADFGEFLQHAHHAVVVLERVHARPGQLVFAGARSL